MRARTKPDKATTKGRIVGFTWWMQKQGYKESTCKSRTTWIKTLVKLRARIYINLEAALFKPVNDEFTVRVANNLEEACELLEAGFEYVTDMDGCKIFRKRK